MDQWSIASSLNRRALLRRAGTAAAGLVALPLSACEAQNSLFSADGAGANPLAIPELNQGIVEQGERVFRLSISAGQKEFVPGVVSPTIGINAPYLGPTLEMRRGERVRLHVDNGLDDGATVHWHGFELPAAADGGPHQLIRPGARWSPSFEVRQRASLYWYHSHLHRGTGPQVYAGLAAPIYVRDDEEDALDLPSEYGVDDIPLIVQDRVLDNSGKLLYPQNMHAQMMGVRGDRLYVNGTQNAVFDARTGQLRLRILNGSNARFYDFSLSGGQTMELIASDGGLLDRPHAVRSLRLAPGERAQILVDLSEGRPLSLLATSPDNSMGMMGNGGGMMGGGMMGRRRDDARTDEPFRILDIRPSGSSPRRNLPPQLAALPALDPSLAVRTRRFVLDMGMMGGGMSINGASMDMNVINERVPVGQWEIWEIANASMMAHPFHIHNVQFRVIDRDGHAPPPLETGFKDTVIVNPREQVRVLLRFEEHSDPDTPYMYHCHILEHEDAGMMGQFVVVNS
ncbi:MULTISPECIES: multicopper oxidase family protein [Erythrobacteraceae]|jgi:FtsP/CotA-like multicopper oxidase with cupredoxin domain|uniref:Multicopper oxidase CueO n=3 Tax=Erythrobacteraceae TaxID=335929 RepID=A0A850H870_9SPHN|nr:MULTISPECIES: multicopper oxidase domain-containing protein [Erythrobacteraceae]KZX53248.1 oxidase [Erythrobacter sp. HI00D59]KZX88197.1 oxidase [Erythrobacter sp. HI0020]KZY15592.1 oxidase [Erythrobacter sp. HI0037]KZY16990.1 oxidase [Erythrobacter sp. HI0038]MXO49537.1 multicopper oxidase domain-containing protein [Qipengyuania vulgaris]|tara:strand:+ start:308 stop:1846 length:1539 start_codon:yes stop_codon:yes gene_type:complete